MNPSTGYLRECKTLFDAYTCCRTKIKSFPIWMKRETYEVVHEEYSCGLHCIQKHEDNNIW
jgi:hypothetical protein